MPAPHPEIPEVIQSEIRHALNRVPNRKASGPDGIPVETLKPGGASLDQQVASLYTKCLKENKIPKAGNPPKWFSFIRREIVKTLRTIDQLVF